jgi:hypothetical protein
VPGQQCKAKNQGQQSPGMVEREAVLPEVRNFGGVYIDLSPQVPNTLKSGSIDPYLIYE